MFCIVPLTRIIIQLIELKATKGNYFTENVLHIVLGRYVNKKESEV